MLLYPSVNKLQEKVDSRYTLVTLTAKRARDLVDGKPALLTKKSEREVSQAAREIMEDLITYKRVDESELAAAEASCEAEAVEEATEVAEAVETVEAEASDEVAVEAEAEVEAAEEVAEVEEA